MATLEELKGAVREALAQRGAVDSLRARARADVFQALEHATDGADEVRPRESAETWLLNELIAEYLEFNGYRHALSVLLPEAGHERPAAAARDRAFLGDQVGLPPAAVRDARTAHIPLLYMLLGQSRSLAAYREARAKHAPAPARFSGMPRGAKAKQAQAQAQAFTGPEAATSPAPRVQQQQQQQLKHTQLTLQQATPPSRAAAAAALDSTSVDSDSVDESDLESAARAEAERHAAGEHDSDSGADDGDDDSIDDDLAGLDHLPAPRSGWRHESRVVATSTVAAAPPRTAAPPPGSTTPGSLMSTPRGSSVASIDEELYDDDDDAFEEPETPSGARAARR